MFERILVATAFDDTSDAAAEMAMDLARLCEANVALVHVIESIGDEPDDTELEEFYSGLRTRAEANMAALSKRFTEAGIRHTTQIRVGVRWESLLAAADEVDASVIVLGSRPIVSQENPRLGTTSHQVFFASRRPLLVARRA